MSRIKKSAPWAVAIAAIAGLGTSVFHYLTSQQTDSAHVNVAATIATINELRWKAHDREHDRLYSDNVRVLSDLREASQTIENLKLAIAAVRNEIELHDDGRNRAAKREAEKADALLMPKEPAQPHVKIHNKRRQIADMVIEIEPEAVQQKAKELYKNESQ